ncbi:MAG: M23 family metallopeptidase [Cyanobacteria bacterium P01_H01_bin.152]
MQSSHSTITHIHRIGLPLLAISREHMVQIGLAAAIAVPTVNAITDGILAPLFPQQQDPMQAIATHAAPFEPMAVYAPHYYDESPPGSYDLTLVDPVTDSENVAVPSPCNGTLNTAGFDAGYGNYAEIRCDDGNTIFMAHASEVWVSKGDSLRKGQTFMVQGSTGNSTGPHLHVEITPPDGDRTNRAKTEPVMEAAIAFWEAGVSPVSPMASAAGSALDDETLKCAIGNAEGTMHDDCSKNPAYFGHTDPGNGAANLGAFSYQHGANSPAEADAKQLQRLRTAEQGIQQRAIAKFGQSLSKAALASALDLWNQSPLAGNDFVDNLTTHNPTPQQIIDARSRSFIDPASGALDAPGLENTMNSVQHDQARRTNEVLEQLNK